DRAAALLCAAAKAARMSKMIQDRIRTNRTRLGRALDRVPLVEDSLCWCEGSLQEGCVPPVGGGRRRKDEGLESPTTPNSPCPRSLLRSSFSHYAALCKVTVCGSG